MKNTNIKLTIFILFLVILIVYNILSYKKKMQRWENMMFNFDLDDIKNKCGHIIVELGDFTDNEKPDLLPSKTTNIRFSEWFNDNKIIDLDGNKQTRIFFKRDTQNPLTLYILEWLDNIKHTLPSEIVNILDSDIPLKFSLRISRGKWEYPSHFDAINTYMLILAGNRHAILDNNHKFNLKTGDILYFAAGVYHHFWCDSFNDLNIALCISYYDENKDANIQSEFQRVYPEQIKKIIKLDDYIDYYSYKK